MSSLVIKVGSLVIKTLSKPIANRIKAQAREHENFRRGCVIVAQGIHRWDMRFRLGLLQDTKDIEKQIARDAAEAHKPPTVKTEAETKKDEARAKDPERERSKAKQPKIRPIKPLPEAKAIELGANFVSETFLLAVGIALILFENARRGRQESKKDEGQIKEIEELKKTVRLQTQGLIEMEKEILLPRPSVAIPRGASHRILPRELRDLEGETDHDAEPPAKGWLSWVPSILKTNNNAGSQSKEPAVTNAAGIAKEAESADPVPAASTSVLDKILSRSHARDMNPKSTDTPAESIPTNAATKGEKRPVANSTGSRENK